MAEDDTSVVVNVLVNDSASYGFSYSFNAMASGNSGTNVAFVNEPPGYTRYWMQNVGMNAGARATVTESVFTFHFEGFAFVNSVPIGDGSYRHQTWSGGIVRFYDATNIQIASYGGATLETCTNVSYESPNFAKTDGRISATGLILYLDSFTGILTGDPVSWGSSGSGNAAFLQSSLRVISVSTPDAAINPDGTVTLTPTPDAPSEIEFTYTIEDASGATDSATVTVQRGVPTPTPTPTPAPSPTPVLDLDIDSDNDETLDRSADEDFLEGHAYGIGKFVPLRGAYVPLKLSFTNVSSIEPDYRIEFTYFGVTSSTDDGYARVEVKLTGGAWRLLGYGETIKFKYLQLTDGVADVRVAGMKSNRHTKTYKSAQENDRQVTSLGVRVLKDGVLFGEGDNVNYFVAEESDFLRELVRNKDLRAALAAQGVYGETDLTKYGMQYIHIGNPQEALNYGIYKDFGSYKRADFGLLTFSGTAMPNLEHWVTNFRQAFGDSTPAYNFAVAQGNALIMGGQVEGIPRAQLLFVGHSLGGGLASAASKKSNGAVKFVTFNAAGLHPNTVITGAVSGKTFKTDFDLLTRLQGNNLLRKLFDDDVPAALGTTISLKSQFHGDNLCAGIDAYFTARTNSLKAFFGSGKNLSGEQRQLVHAGVESHLMTQVIFGLLEKAGVASAFGYPKKVGLFIPWE